MPSCSGSASAGSMKAARVRAAMGLAIDMGGLRAYHGRNASAVPVALRARAVASHRAVPGPAMNSAAASGGARAAAAAQVAARQGPAGHGRAAAVPARLGGLRGGRARPHRRRACRSCRRCCATRRCWRSPRRRSTARWSMPTWPAARRRPARRRSRPTCRSTWPATTTLFGALDEFDPAYAHIQRAIARSYGELLAAPMRRPTGPTCASRSRGPPTSWRSAAAA